MNGEQPVPETKGVTVKLLATVDLGPEIDGMAGRELRMRMVTMEPGGVFGPMHDHKDRPGIVYILQGTITDHRNGGVPSMGRAWAGRRTGTRSTGSRTPDRPRLWKFRSISCGSSRLANQRGDLTAHQIIGGHGHANVYGAVRVYAQSLGLVRSCAARPRGELRSHGAAFRWSPDRAVLHTGR